MRNRLDSHRLRALIRQSRISQNHWALRLGISRGHLSDLVNGRHPYPSASTRKRLLETFDLPFEALFVAQDEPLAEGPQPAPSGAAQALAAIAFEALDKDGESLPSATEALRQRIQECPQDPELNSPRRFIRTLAASLDSHDAPVGTAFRRTRTRSARPQRARPWDIKSWSTWTMDGLRQDLALAGHLLARTPGFAVLVALTLALGVGANTVMFTLVDSVLLEPLPFPDSDRLVMLREEDAMGRQMWASYPNFADWRSADGGQHFAAMAAVTWPRAETVPGPEGPIRAKVAQVSADYFEVVGVAPHTGRWIASDENRPGAPPVAVVSHDFWQRVLGSPNSVAGVTIPIGGELHEVVGVAPPGFSVIGEPDLWLSLQRAVPWTIRGNHVLPVIARLRLDADPQLAHRALDAIGARIAEAHPGETEAVGVAMKPLKEWVVGSATQPLRLLMLASGLLLLVACANIASGLLGRGEARRRELAIRVSLGASRARLLRQLITENAVLAVLGAAAGLGTAWATLGFLQRAAPAALPRLEGAALDSRALLFTLGVALLSIFLFGLLPALSLAGRSARNALSAAARTRADRRHSGAWRALVSAQVAAAMVLLSGAGLLVHSLWKILSAEVGYDPRGVLTATLDLPANAEPAELHRSYERVVASLAAIPGVEAAGFANLLPLDAGNFVGPVVMETAEEGPVAHYRIADAGYFQTLGIPLLRGRLIGRQDDASSEHVAIVNRSMAEVYWPGQDPIGQQFHLGGMDPYGGHGLTVVGVVGEARHWRMRPGTQLEYYVALSQRPALGHTLEVVIKSAKGAPNDLAARVREAVRATAPAASITLDRLDHRVAGTTVDRRLAAAVLAALAIVALCLALAGIYAVFAYAVARRRQEMGIRLALGAVPRHLIAMVLGEAARTLALGLAVGLLGTGMLTRLLRSQLYETSPLNPAVLATAVLSLALVGLFASWIPAMRTRHVDPAREIQGD